MNINSAFPSNYLKASDIPAGRQIAVTIDSVVIEKVGSDERPVAYFLGSEKGLILNKTNSKVIVEIAKTDETDNWGGVRISLYSAKVDFKGSLVDAIRVGAPPAPSPQQRTMAEVGRINTAGLHSAGRPLAQPNGAANAAPEVPPEAYDPDEQATGAFPWEK